MNTSSENLITDRRIGERKRTNVFAVFFCIGLVLILFAFIGYAASNGNIYRTINGVDDCGNICGMKNDNNSIDFCGPTDKTNDKFQLWNITDIPDNTSIPVTTPRPSNWTTEPPIEDDFIISNATKHQEVHLMCVAKCEDFPGYKAIGNRCFQGQNQTDPKSFAFFLQALSQDMTHSWHLILICCFVALVFSYVILFLFRHAIKYVIWSIIIGIIVLLTALCIAFLVGSAFAAKSDNENTRGLATFLFIASGVFGLMAIIVPCCIFVFRKRITLIIEIFKEAAKAIGDVPLIIIEPVATFVALAVTFILFLFSVVVIASAGHFTIHKDANGKFLKASYDPDAIMITAYAVNFLALIWFVQFVMGCQHFIIGSTISDWYFANNKNKLGSPIRRAFGNLLNFHLGSICLGSLLMMAISFVRGIVNSIKESMKNSESIATRIAAAACFCGIEILEEILQYLVHTAYIIVAKDGTPLYASGKRAFHLLKNHVIDVIALNKVGDMVLTLARWLVVIVTGCVAYVIISKRDEIQIIWLPVAIVCIFAYLIIHCFMTVFEITLETIFICFCEDIEQNNGIDRDYFMSKKMMEVMQELKQQAGGQFNFYRHPGVPAVQSTIPYQRIAASAWTGY